MRTWSSCSRCAWTPSCCVPASPAPPRRPASWSCTATSSSTARLVDRPSFRVKPGQLIHVKAKSEGTEPFQVAAAGGHAEVLPPVPGYLEVELDKLHARLLRRPKRAEVPVTGDVQLVVEYYAAR